MPKPIKLTKADIVNFWTRVEKFGINDCWRWHGHHDKNGYPIFHPTIGWYRANRVACFLVYKDAGSMTCHTCRNPSCINPKHLYPGNGKLNSKDRDRVPHGIHGERCHLAKLTNRQVKRIAKLHKIGKTNRQIADCMHIRCRLVQRVCSGECWSWLTGFSKK